MRRVRGQSASEISLVVAVIALAAVAASSTLIPLFQSGTRDLAGNLRQNGGAGGGEDASGRGTATAEDVVQAMAGSNPNADIGPPAPLTN